MCNTCKQKIHLDESKWIFYSPLGSFAWAVNYLRFEDFLAFFVAFFFATFFDFLAAFFFAAIVVELMSKRFVQKILPD